MSLLATQPLEPIELSIALKKTETALENAVAALPHAVQALRQCHTEDAPSHPEFRELRGQLTSCSLVYKDYHLPKCEKLVLELKSQLELYSLNSVEEFLEDVEAYAEIAEDNAEAAKAVVKAHEVLCTDLVKIADAAKNATRKLQLEAETQKNIAENHLEVCLWLFIVLLLSLQCWDL